jgi:hypothetical protein
MIPLLFRHLSLVLILLIPAYAITINKDTCNFVEMNQYANIINNSENEITIDTIQIILFNQNPFFQDRMYTSFCCINNSALKLSMLPDSSFIAKYDSGNTKLTINKKDSLKFNFTIVIPWVLYSLGPGYLIDTLMVRFKSSDKTSDTIIAISRVTYASAIKNSIKFNKIKVSDCENRNEFLLNGIKITNKVNKINKVIVRNSVNKNVLK